MPDLSVLIVYGTRHGQTAKIVRFIADVFRTEGHLTQLLRAETLPPGFALEPFDAVVVAAPVHFGRHPDSVRNFARAHAEGLNEMPGAFVSVSGAAMGSSEEERAEAEGYVKAFVAETGWRPHRMLSVAGAVRYTRYWFLLRWVMQRISRRRGLATDTSRDHEYTDWAEVERFARAFVGDLQPAGATRTARGR